MNKFWAKVRFKEKENADFLTKSFFLEFNPQSSIIVRDKEIKLEVFFNKPPMGIINAINKGEVEELIYGKKLEEYEEDADTHDVEELKENETELEKTRDEKSEQNEQTKQYEQNEQTEQEKVGGEQPERTEQPKKRKGKTATKKKDTTAKTAKNEIKPADIPELEEIAKNATSFEDFVKLVAEWLEMDKRQEFLVKLAIASSEVNKLSWKELENALNSKGETYGEWEKIQTCRQVSEKLKERSVTMLPLLNAIRQYKDYSFKNAEKISKKETSIEQHEKEETSQNVEKTGEFDESIIPKPRVKMECMPEIKDFEETLASVDTTKPVEERVRYVLNAMGLNNMSIKEQEQIVEFASLALRKSRMSFENICVEANIPIDQTMEVGIGNKQ